jgi:hypothetical protein
MKRLMRYVVFFVGALLIVITGIMQCSASQYWEPRHTLKKNDLNVYNLPTTPRTSEELKICSGG